MILFVLFAAIVILAVVGALKQLRSEGLPRGSATWDSGADGIYFDSSGCSHHHGSSHDGGHDSGGHGGFDGGHGLDGGGHH